MRTWKSTIAFATAALLLSACTLVPPNPDLEASAKAPLTCKDKAQCDTYWHRATVWILSSGLDRVLHVLTSEDQASARLRSSTPFTGIHSDAERVQLFNRWVEKQD